MNTLTISPTNAMPTPAAFCDVNLAEMEQVEGGCLFAAFVAVAPAAIPIAIAAVAVYAIYCAVS
jgi:hypothetical protein